MRTRRRDDEKPQDTPHRGDPADDGGLGAAREQGGDLLAAGDDAIRQALSGDSRAWLRANRQEGGQ
jgi:hypothetical protein